MSVESEFVEHINSQGGTAFPTDIEDAGAWTGMTLRDWFAGQALSGWLASFGPDDTLSDKAGVARFSYEVADAMLEARKP